MEDISVDIVVIGSGPAGQKAAIGAAKLKKKVVVIEHENFLGGACLHTGTIPSKTLRAAILDLTQFYSRSFYSTEYEVQDISISDLSFRLNQVKENQLISIRRQFKKNSIELIDGKAEFLDSNQLLVRNQEGEVCAKISFLQAIIAAGSKPRNPKEVPFDQKRILDSSSLLKIDKLPSSMIVLGSGVIGAEYASFFAALGVQVSVIDKKDHMLPRLDREIGIHLQDGLSSIGLQFFGNKHPDTIGVEGNKAFVVCKDKQRFEADILLYALGRTANVEDLKLENTGIEVDGRGYICVDGSFKTNVENIYAVGDVIGGASLASTSMEQGRLAATHACTHKTLAFPTVFPLGIYTIPEISCCGYTEEEVKKMGIEYEIGRAYYYEIAASHIYSSNDMGVFKIIFNKSSREILGVHIVGRQATEVIHIGQMAMRYKATIDIFINQIFNYPTYAEGYRIAALNGFNKL